ncbi:MAG: hypothetical protein VKN72_03920 [Nostocales cyanobacterium 94392]|nr:hypothetical protein [Nostocales cyanobacterium 94392]
MALQVAQQPNNLPTEPLRMAAPTQPALSLNTVTQPTQPTLSPRVAQPIQPQLNPQIQQPNLPQFNVNNIPRFVPLGEMVKTKFPGIYDEIDSGELGLIVSQKYPGVYDQFIDPLPKQEEGEKGVKGAALGFTKGRLKTLKNVAKATSYLFGRQKEVGATLDYFLPDENLQTQGTAEKVGDVAGSIGEFLLPAGLIGKAGKAIDAGVKSLNYGSKATKALQLAGKAGLGAVEAGTISKLQGQSNKDALINAGIGSAIPIASKLITPIKNSQAGRFINSLIKPKEIDFRFGKNPGQAVAEAGITGNTLKGLKDNIRKVRQSTGKEIEAQLQKAINTKQDVSPIFKVIDDAIGAAVNRGEQDYVNRLIQLRNGLTKKFKLVDGELKVIGEKNLVLNPLEIQKLKIQVGEGTRWTGQAFDADINQVKVKLYQALNDLVEKAAPGSKKLNLKYSNLLTAEKAAEKRISTASKNNLLNLPNLSLGGTGAIVGGFSSGAAIPALLAGAGAVGVSKILGSTAVKSRVATQLAKPAKRGFERASKVYFGTREKEPKSQ